MEGVVEMAKASKSSGESDPVIVKKYANRRLYNTETSSYITLDLLSQMTREGREFVVVDAKTNEDITHNVLTQIIMEEEGRGKNMLPVNFLRQLISMYGDSMQYRKSVVTGKGVSVCVNLVGRRNFKKKNK